jgi:hypothetical protein
MSIEVTTMPGKGEKGKGGRGRPKESGTPVSTSLRPTEALWARLLEVHGRYPGISRNDLMVYALEVGLEALASDPALLQKKVLEALSGAKES